MGERLGQHFLHSAAVRDEIVGAAKIAPGEIVLEIGPGEGFLTEALLATGARVVAVEKDDTLADSLRERFADAVERGVLTIVSADVRTFRPEVHGVVDGAYKLVANIPYYITGEILRRFIGGDIQPTRAVLLVQKEVAERVAAKDGAQSVLSHAIHVYGTPSVARVVKAGSFRPPPKVDSAVLLIENISRARFKSPEEEMRFFTLVKSAFAHPRKKVLSNVPEEYREKLREELKARGLSEAARAETIPLAVWLSLIQN